MVGGDDISSEATGSTSFTIEQVSAQTGLTKRTLRYYEEMGLLPPTGRTEGNYRRYTQEDVQRLERIKNLRNLLSFSLADIREILQADDERSQLSAAYQQETEAAGKIAQIERIDTVVRHQLELVEQKIAGLEQMRTKLLDKLSHLEQHRLELQRDVTTTDK